MLLALLKVFGDCKRWIKHRGHWCLILTCIKAFLNCLAQVSNSTVLEQVTLYTYTVSYKKGFALKQLCCCYCSYAGARPILHKPFACCWFISSHLFVPCRFNLGHFAFKETIKNTEIWYPFAKMSIPTIPIQNPVILRNNSMLILFVMFFWYQVSYTRGSYGK